MKRLFLSICALGALICGCEYISFENDNDSADGDNSGSAIYDGANFPVSIADEGVSIVDDPGRQDPYN